MFCALSLLYVQHLCVEPPVLIHEWRTLLPLLLLSEIASDKCLPQKRKQNAHTHDGEEGMKSFRCHQINSVNLASGLCWALTHRVDASRIKYMAQSQWQTIFIYGPIVYHLKWGSRFYLIQLSLTLKLILIILETLQTFIMLFFGRKEREKKHVPSLFINITRSNC